MKQKSQNYFQDNNNVTKNGTIPGRQRVSETALTKFVKQREIKIEKGRERGRVKIDIKRDQELKRGRERCNERERERERCIEREREREKERDRQI